eukprot:scaffold75019_cov22-Prasinocladus_malaysianus.AAC.1
MHAKAFEALGIIWVAGDSLTIKWNEYPTAFWCDDFTSGDSCTAENRPIFEKYFGWPFNAVSLGIAGGV